MQTYCSGCKKHTDNMCQKIKKKKKIMANKEIKEKWICDECIANKLFLIK